MSEFNITEQEAFDALISDIQDEGRHAAVLFTAPAWCIPCRRFEPHWERAAADPDLAHITFIKVDMGETPENTGEHWATARYHILGVPNVRYFKKGMEAVDIQSRTIVPLKRELLEFGKR